MRSKQLTGSAMAMLAALIWGSAFVAQDMALEKIGPITLVAARSWVAVIALLPFCIMDHKRLKKLPPVPGYRKNLWIACLVCGTFLFGGAGLQSLGMVYTSVGKAGFLTALYMIFVPLIGLLRGKRLPGIVWVAVGITACGMYLLCVPREQFSLNLGDGLMIICAIFYALQIIAVDHYVDKVSGVQMSCTQFLWMAVMATAVAIFTEHPTWPALASATLPVLYVGALSGALGFTLQILAQKRIAPAVASLIMSMESVFAALFGWLILGQALSPRELAGCALVFCAIVLVQLPSLLRSRIRESSL